MDGMRGYAALLVTLTHFLLAYMGGFRSVDLAQVTFASLHNGVDRLYLWLALNMQSLYVLLTISGFMVCRMIMRRTYLGFGRFILGRSLRILPPFLFSLVFAVLIAKAIPVPVRLDLWDLTYNVLMLNGIFEISGQPYNFPSWTLFYETIYCLLVPGMVAMALARNTRHRMLLFAGCWILILAGMSRLHFSGWPFFTPFAVGSILAQIDDRWLATAAAKLPTPVVVAAYLFVSALPISWAPLPTFDAHGIHFASQYLIFIALACLMSSALIVKSVFSAGLLQRAFSLGPLRYLGKISYSFYLLHAPLIGVTVILVANFASQRFQAGSIAHFAVLLLAFWFMTSAAATAGFYAVEMLYFRSSFSSRSKSRTALRPIPEPKVTGGAPSHAATSAPAGTYRL